MTARIVTHFQQVYFVKSFLISQIVIIFIKCLSEPSLLLQSNYLILVYSTMNMGGRLKPK